jgi:hypothetical protein
MSGSKHDKSSGPSPFPDDLERNPGIGQSKGSFATGEDPSTLEGDNTSEGDVENDPSPNRVGVRKQAGTNEQIGFARLPSAQAAARSSGVLLSGVANAGTCSRSSP